MTHLIAIGGLSGSGKSTLGRALEKIIPNCVRIESDVVRKELMGVSADTRLPSSAYEWAITKKMIDEMKKQTDHALKDGKTVIVESIFNSADARDAQERIAKNANARFTGLYLTAPIDELKSRVHQRTLKNADTSDATIDILERQIATGAGNVSWHKIDAGRGPDNVLADVLTIFQIAKA